MLMRTPKEMRPGESLEMDTLKGCVRWFLLGWICFFGMWYVDCIGYWMDNVFGVVSDPPTIGQIRFQRFLAISLAGTTIVGSFFMGLNIYIKQKNAKKSARGQWYDKESLTREELYGDKEGPED